MTDPSTPDNVRNYLASLEAAMVGIPEDTSRDIIGAIREELFGLDAAAAAKRIRRFGDPQFIASEARAAGSMAASAADAEAGAGPRAAATPAEAPHGTAAQSTGTGAPTTFAESKSPAAPRTGEPRWYAIISVLVIMFGSFAVPVLGTVAGFIMMWFSKAWTRTEKWIATLIPVASFVIIAVASMLPRSLEDPVETMETGGSGGFYAPTIEQFTAVDGLVPNTLLMWNLGVVMLLVIPIAVGLGLLWRATRNWAAAGRN